MEIQNSVSRDQINLKDVSGSTIIINGQAQTSSNTHTSLPKSPILPPCPAVQRDSMLKKIDEGFKEKQCVVISGIGGSGKTSLAYSYIYTKLIEHYIWVSIDNSLETEIPTKIAKYLNESAANLEDLQTILNNINTNNNLLVIDIKGNSSKIKTEIEDDIYKYFLNEKWRILVLTRTHPLNYQYFITKEMDILTDDEAEKMFMYYFKMKQNNNQRIESIEQYVNYITKELYYHPLLIAATAFYYAKKSLFQNIMEIYDELKENKINNKHTGVKLTGLIKNDNKGDLLLYDYLINICNIKDNNPEEKELLGYFITWPNEPIDMDIIKKLHPNFKESALDTLEARGILFRNNDDTYTIPSLITDVLREQIKQDKIDYTNYLKNIKNELNKNEKIDDLTLKCIINSIFNNKCNINEQIDILHCILPKDNNNILKNYSNKINNLYRTLTSQLKLLEVVKNKIDNSKSESHTDLE